MQIIWLRAFVALKKQMSFSNAAEELFISQSSFSKYIQSIEKTTNVRLFDRSSRKIKLTPAGEAFYLYAEHIVQEYDEMMTAMQEFSKDSQQTIRIASVSAVNIYAYATLFYQFFRNNPELDFCMEELEMSRALRALQEGRVDFAVVRTNLVDPQLGYQEICFNREEMFFVCGKKYPRIFGPEISLRDILKERLVFQKFAFDEMKLLMANYGIAPKDIKVRAITSQNRVLENYLKDGIAASIISQSLADTLDSEGELLRIPISERPEMTLGMLMKKELPTGACRQFVRFIQDSLQIYEK